MQSFLAELRDRAWIATVLMGAVTACCATLRLDFLTATAAMTAGALIMWKSEEGADEDPSMLARLEEVVPAEPAALTPATAPAPALAPAG